MSSPSDFKAKELVVIPGSWEFGPPTKVAAIVPSQVLASYGESTVTMTGTSMQPFAYPSTGIDTHRAKDFTVSSESQVSFTYSGAETRWFRISAVCNVVKDAAAQSTPRKIAFVWRRNGVDVGYTRKQHMPVGMDCTIVAATGQLPLSQGDVLVPCCCDEDDGGEYMLQMCSFDIQEDTPVRL